MIRLIGAIRSEIMRNGYMNFAEFIRRKRKTIFIVLNCTEGQIIVLADQESCMSS